MPWGLGRKDKKKHEKEVKAGAEVKLLSKTLLGSPTHQHVGINGPGNKQHSKSTSSIPGLNTGPGSKSPTPSNSSQDLIDQVLSPSNSITSRRKSSSGIIVAAHKAFYEDLTLKKKSSPGQKNNSSILEKTKGGFSESFLSESNSSGRISVSVTSPTSEVNWNSTAYLKGLGDFTTSSSHSGLRDNDSPCFYDMAMGKEKYFDGIDLPLPPLQMTAVRHREVDARRNSQSGGFGFILRKSYLPSPEEPDKTKLVHLIEPRSDYYGPLMTGDRIIGVNGDDVEGVPHEAVVEMIKASGECVQLRVASMPELMELNERGALDNPMKRSSAFRKFGRAKHETGQSSDLSLSLTTSLYYSVLLKPSLSIFFCSFSSSSSAL